MLLSFSWVDEGNKDNKDQVGLIAICNESDLEAFVLAVNTQHGFVASSVSETRVVVVIGQSGLKANGLWVEHEHTGPHYNRPAVETFLRVTTGGITAVAMAA